MQMLTIRTAKKEAQYFLSNGKIMATEREIAPKKWCSSCLHLHEREGVFICGMLADTPPDSRMDCPLWDDVDEFLNS